MVTRWLCIFSLYLFAVGIAFGEGTYQRTKDGKTIVWNDDPKPGDTSTWSGDRDAEGYANRIGTLTWYTARGNVYASFRGNMVRGKFSGMVNGYSRKKSGHALFVAGHRTTRWTAGTSAASEVAQAPTAPAKTQKEEAKVEESRTAAVPSGRAAPEPIKPEPNESPSEKLLKEIAPEQDREKTRPFVTTVEPNPLPENSAPNVEPSPEPTGPDLSKPETNEVASHQTSSPPPAATPEEPRDESRNAEPEAPAEGPRVEIPEAPSATASASPAEEQAIEEKSPTPVPEEAAANGPATSEKPPDSVAPTPSAKTEMATSPQAHPNLTIEEVTRLANAELRKQGVNRMQYVRQQPRFDADHRAWSVAYDPMTFDGIETGGQHLSIVIDDRTKGAMFLLRK